MDGECYKLSMQIDELFFENKKLREALHLISEVCGKPAHVMTKSELEDAIDACKIISCSAICAPK